MKSESPTSSPSFSHSHPSSANINTTSNGNGNGTSSSSLTALLTPHIHAILSSPNTDLATISARRIRKLIVQRAPTLKDLVRDNKEEVDALCGSVFEVVSERVGFRGAAGGEQGEGNEEGDVKQEDEEEDGDEEDRSNRQRDRKRKRTVSPSPPPRQAQPHPESKHKRQLIKTLTDEEYARQLSSELNANLNARASRSSNGTGTGTGKAKKSKTKGESKKSPTKKSKKHKSADEVDSGSDDGGGGTKKKKTGGAKGGFSKEFLLSDPLSHVVGKPKLSRPQVVKHLWDYIKLHDLQNPQDRREILCDPNLRALFGTDKITMFKMNKVLGAHLHEDE